MDIAERMQVAPDLVAIAAMCALGVVAASARTVTPPAHAAIQWSARTAAAAGDEVGSPVLVAPSRGDAAGLAGFTGSRRSPQVAEPRAPQAG